MFTLKPRPHSPSKNKTPVKGRAAQSTQLVKDQSILQEKVWLRQNPDHL